MAETDPESVPAGDDALAAHVLVNVDRATAVATTRVWLESTTPERAGDALDFLQHATLDQMTAVIGILPDHDVRGAVLAVTIASCPAFVDLARERAIFVLTAFARQAGLPAEVARAGLAGLADDPDVGAASAAALASLD